VKSRKILQVGDRGFLTPIVYDEVLSLLSRPNLMTLSKSSWYMRILLLPRSLRPFPRIPGSYNQGCVFWHLENWSWEAWK